MEIGIDSFGLIFPDIANHKALTPAEHLANLLEEAELADRRGLDSFGIGEHHRKEFLESAPSVILAAVAARTSSIRLHSAVTVLSAADPVRVFQEFATLDLLSKGRAEIVAGRGSSVEAFPLFGLPLELYDDLFVEKLDLLLKLRKETHITWSGKFRPALNGEGVFPRPYRDELPIWVGVGGTPQSFVRAGTLGLPLMLAVIGGNFQRFRPLVDLYREAGLLACHSPDRLKVGLHAIGFVSDTFDHAVETMYPGWRHMFSTVGAERGWSTPMRRQFDAECGPDGAYLIGDPKTVAEKLLHAGEILGGLSRVSFQMSMASFDHESMMRSIELLGTKVAPIVRDARRASAA